MGRISSKELYAGLPGELAHYWDVSNKFQRWLVLELMKPIVFAGSLLEKIGEPLLLPRAIRSSITRQNQFALEIQRDLAFLFDDHHGQIIPDESVRHPLPFDCASVIVAADDLCFRFFRGRGDLRVQIAPEHAPEDWGELPLILSWLGWRDQLGPRSFVSLQDVADVLRPRMHSIREAYSAERYTQMKTMLSEEREHEQVAARQLAAEINRRLYP